MVTIHNTLLGGKIGTNDETSWSGILFWLNGKPRTKKIYHLENWDIEFSDTCFIVARTKDTLSNENMREKGYNICEKALDLYCADGYGGFYIISPFEKHLLLSNIDGKSSLWISCAEEFTMKVSLTLDVQDKNGNIKPRVPRQQTCWESVYSYYRYSKLSNNLYDEYRWMYLVFEAILQKIAPINFDTTKNKPKEGEWAWIRRALNEADAKYGWIRAMKWPTTDSIAYFHTHQYNGVRCNLFHSKGGILLPNEHISLDVVSKRLKELDQLCVFLMGCTYHINSSRGGFLTDEGFEMFMDQLFCNASAVLSEADIVSLGNAVSLNDMDPFLCLNKIPEKSVQQDGISIHVFYAPFPTDEERKVRSYGVTQDDSLAIYDHPYAYTLSVQGIDDVYLVQMVKRVHYCNKKQHKQSGVVLLDQRSI